MNTEKADFKTKDKTLIDFAFNPLRSDLIRVQRVFVLVLRIQTHSESRKVASPKESV